MAQLLAGTAIGVGAQNCFWEASGAFTGEVSPTMIKEAGAQYVIIGHSDCAAEAQRVKTALQASGYTLDRCWVVVTGVAIGAHAGPGSLVIGVQDYEAPGR